MLAASQARLRLARGRARFRLASSALRRRSLGHGANAYRVSRRLYMHSKHALHNHIYTQRHNRSKDFLRIVKGKNLCAPPNGTPPSEMKACHFSVNCLLTSAPGRMHFCIYCSTARPEDPWLYRPSFDRTYISIYALLHILHYTVQQYRSAEVAIYF